MRRVVVFASMVVCTQASAQTTSDPTFNGLINRVTCYDRTLVVCKGDYCFQPQATAIGGRGGELRFDLKNRAYASTSGTPGPLEITKQSEPKLNEPLSLEFKIARNSEHFAMALYLRPIYGGTYAISAVAKLIDSTLDPGVMAFETFECTSE